MFSLVKYNDNFRLIQAFSRYILFLGRIGSLPSLSSVLYLECGGLTPLCFAEVVKDRVTFGIEFDDCPMFICCCSNSVGRKAASSRRSPKRLRRKEAMVLSRKRSHAPIGRGAESLSLNKGNYSGISWS